MVIPVDSEEASMLFIISLSSAICNHMDLISTTFTAIPLLRAQVFSLRSTPSNTQVYIHVVKRGFKKCPNMLKSLQVFTNDPRIMTEK